MNEMALQDNFDKVIELVTRIKYSSDKNENSLLAVNKYIDELKVLLNNLFESIVCVDIVYTLNSDKDYFGIIVNPFIDGTNAIKILATDEPVILTKYQLELDSRMLESNLTPEEIVSLIVFEISSTMNPGQINRVRELIDINMVTADDVLPIRDSLNYAQLIIYGIKDTLNKISSILYKEDADDILSNPMIQALKLQDTILSTQEKLVSNVFGIIDSLSAPKAVILQWVFMIYQDVKGYSAHAIETLKDAKSFTASKLIKSEIDKVITALSRISTSTIQENTKLTKVFEEKAMYSLNELSLFKALKADGLRKIEDDYYELAVQVKAIDTESDAIYVLRAINSRLSILEDYIYNNTLKESDKKHWLGIAKLYRDLRTALVNKKINKRKYSDIFMDYNDFESDND